jgi:DnaJ-domain-containing protein 1
VEGFIDRLAGILRSLFSDDGTAPRGGRDAGAARQRPHDPDLQAAQEELDEFMRTGSSSRGQERARRASPPPRQPVDETLRQDYANLEVPFGSDIETVRRSYKKLMLKYHPDKHAGDAEKQKLALEITKKVNESFERIRARSS